MNKQYQNTLEFLGYYGGDKTHALSAWTSTFVELGIKIPEKIEDRVDAIFQFVCKHKKKSPDELLTMLAEAGHHTPFEKSSIHFQVTSEIASHIHKLKHRIGVSVNGESARYKELMEDKYYLPEDWKGVMYNGRDAEYHGMDWYQVLDLKTKQDNRLYHEALKDLEKELGRKRAKESARFFKGYNMQYTVDIMFNWRSFYHFQKLRNDNHAQKEIREIAQRMLAEVKNIPGNPFGLTIKAFGLENK
jgi:flavin-dependent thymidylate synthase